jgi:hypothetical protein
MRTTHRIASLVVTGALSLAAASNAHAQSMAPTASQYGMLRDTDRTDASGRHIQTLSISIYAGQDVDVGLQSLSFDPMLWVLGPDGTMVASNDDAPGEGLNSRVRFRAMTAGYYRVVVTSYAPGATGAYHLDITRSAGAVAQPSAPAGAGTGDDDDEQPAYDPGIADDERGGSSAQDEEWAARRARWHRRQEWRRRHGW